MSEKSIPGDWFTALEAELNKEYYKSLMGFIEEEYESEKVYPPKDELYTALELTPLSKVKVVIIGQDPYHEPGQAHGLSFSVKPGVKVPPSLQNIYKELNSDLGLYIPNNGYLVKWASQGVLMLNNVLTVRAHEANSHKGFGWEQFTDAVISTLNKEDRPIVFLLWGKPAMTKCKRLDNPNHLILTAPHPSPLSSYRGFFGCRHFSQTNDFLISQGLEPVDWQIENI